jgi:hypothetical protein
LLFCGGLGRVLRRKSALKLDMGDGG